MSNPSARFVADLRYVDDDTLATILERLDEVRQAVAERTVSELSISFDRETWGAAVGMWMHHYPTGFVSISIDAVSGIGETL